MATDYDSGRAKIDELLAARAVAGLLGLDSCLYL